MADDFCMPYTLERCFLKMNTLNIGSQRTGMRKRSSVQLWRP